MITDPKTLRAFCKWSGLGENTFIRAVMNNTYPPDIINNVLRELVSEWNRKHIKPPTYGILYIFPDDIDEMYNIYMRSLKQ